MRLTDNGIQSTPWEESVLRLVAADVRYQALSEVRPWLDFPFRRAVKARMRAHDRLCEAIQDRVSADREVDPDRTEPITGYFLGDMSAQEVLDMKKELLESDCLDAPTNPKPERGEV